MNISFGPYSETTDEMSQLVHLLKDMSRETKAMISTLQDEVFGLREMVGSLQVELITTREEWYSSQDGIRSPYEPKSAHSYSEPRQGYSAAIMSGKPITPPSDPFIPRSASGTIEFSSMYMEDDGVYFSPLDPHPYRISVTEADTHPDISLRSPHSQPSQAINATPSIHITSTPRQPTRASTGMTIEVHLAQTPLQSLPAPNLLFPTDPNNQSNYCTSPIEVECISPIPAPVFHPTSTQHINTSTPAAPSPTATHPSCNSPRILPCTPEPHSFSFVPAQAGDEGDDFDGIFIVEETTPSNMESPKSDTTLVNSDTDNAATPLDPRPTMPRGEPSHTDKHVDTPPTNAVAPMDVLNRLHKHVPASVPTHVLLQHAIIIILVACLVPLGLTAPRTLFNVLLLAAGMEAYMWVGSRRFRDHGSTGSDTVIYENAAVDGRSPVVAR